MNPTAREDEGPKEEGAKTHLNEAVGESGDGSIEEGTKEATFGDEQEAADGRHDPGHHMNMKPRPWSE